MAEDGPVTGVSGWSPLLALVPLLPVLPLAGAGLGRQLRQRRRARRALFLANLERDTITALYPTSASGAGRAAAGAHYTGGGTTHRRPPHPPASPAPGQPRQQAASVRHAIGGAVRTRPPPRGGVTPIRVSRGTILAAAFDDGRDPPYHGAHGRRVRALVAAPHAVDHPQVDETAPGPTDHGPGWWAATIHSAGLEAGGFRVATTQRPD